MQRRDEALQNVQKALEEQSEAAPTAFFAACAGLLFPSRTSNTMLSNEAFHSLGGVELFC